MYNNDTERLFAEGGMNDEGGTVDPVSGNDVPAGSLQNEVRDDIDAKLSEGEFVVPADVVRYIGLERLMKLRDEAKAGLARMNEIGQMGNAEEVENPEALQEDEEDNLRNLIDLDQQRFHRQQNASMELDRIADELLLTDDERKNQAFQDELDRIAELGVQSNQVGKARMLVEEKINQARQDGADEYQKQIKQMMKDTLDHGDTIFSSLGDFAKASMDFQTRCPHAMIVTSVPSAKISALPMTNFASGLTKIGITGRPKRK